MTTQLLSLQQIADANGWNIFTVRRWRQKLGLGTPFNRTYLLTPADAKEIGKHIRPGLPGNPEFGPKFKGGKKRKPA